MAEKNTQPETTVEEQEVAEKAPGKFKTFVTKHRRTIAASTIALVAGAAAGVKVKSALSDSSPSAPDTVAGEVTSTADYAPSEA